MRSFVLGNGRSRNVLRIGELRPYGKIYGCNALYREFEPDFLIAVDPKMILEINKSGYQNNHEVWTNPNSRYRQFKNFKFFSPVLGWSSGPTALNMAVQHGANEIYIFGFDYEGQQGLFNNVYADTPNYKKSTDTATYYGNWIRQTETIIKSNPNKKFFRVVQERYYSPDWVYHNFRNITYEDLYKLMPTWPKKT